MSDEITTRMDGHVAVVSFSRPPHNHVSVELLTALADTFDTLDADPECRAIVLRAEGKVFCAGADLSPGRGSEATPLGFSTSQLYAQAARLFGTAKPVVAAVQGAAVGAGLGLALVADFRVVAPEARFTANFVKLGFHPGFGITHSLPRVIGQQRASRLLLTGERVSGEEALALGLADAIAPLAELIDRAVAFAASIAENAPLAVEATRATLRAGLVDAIRAATAIEEQKQMVLMKTADFAEGTLAVGERRPGRFVRG